MAEPVRIHWPYEQEPPPAIIAWRKGTHHPEAQTWERTYVAVDALLSDEVVAVAAAEFACDDCEPYLGSDDARAGWARSVLVTALASAERTGCQPTDTPFAAPDVMTGYPLSKDEQEAVDRVASASAMRTGGPS